MLDIRGSRMYHLYFNIDQAGQCQCPRGGGHLGIQHFGVAVEERESVGGNLENVARQNVVEFVRKKRQYLPCPCSSLHVDRSIS